MINSACEVFKKTLSEMSHDVEAHEIQSHLLKASDSGINFTNFYPRDLLPSHLEICFLCTLKPVKERKHFQTNRT